MRAAASGEQGESEGFHRGGIGPWEMRSGTPEDNWEQVENFRRPTEVRLSACTWTSAPRARCSHPSSAWRWAVHAAAGRAAPGAHALLRLRAHGRRVLPRQLLPQPLRRATSYPWVSRVALGATMLLGVAGARRRRSPSSSSSWASARAPTCSAGGSPCSRPCSGWPSAVTPLADNSVGAGGAGRLGARRAAAPRCRCCCDRMRQTRVAHRAAAADVPGHRRRARPSSSPALDFLARFDCPSPRWGRSSPRSTCSSSRRRCCGCG